MGQPVCPDPECFDGSGRSRAELEHDGEHRYFACSTCGYSFGYQQVAAAESETGCPVGIPEHIRRAATPAGASGRPAPVLLQIGRRPG